LAGVIAWRTCSANIRPQGVDRARRGHADIAYKSRTAIAMAPHAPPLVIDEGAGKPVEIGVVL
jgi:hypothetical protein